MSYDELLASTSHIVYQISNIIADNHVNVKVVRVIRKCLLLPTETTGQWRQTPRSAQQSTADLDSYSCHLPIVCVSKVIRNDHLNGRLVIFMRKMCPTWLQRLHTDDKCPSAPINGSTTSSRQLTGIIYHCVFKVIRNDHLNGSLLIFMKKMCQTWLHPQSRRMPQRAHHRSSAYLISTAIGVIYPWSVWPKSLGMTTWVGT